MLALRLALLAGRHSLGSRTAPAASSANRLSHSRGMAGQAAGGAAAGGTAVPRPAEVEAALEGAEQPQQPRQPRVRDYPEEPRVGVGVVILRALPPAQEPEVLLIRRAKEPSKGGCAPASVLALQNPLSLLLSFDSMLAFSEAPKAALAHA